MQWSREFPEGLPLAALELVWEIFHSSLHIKTNSNGAPVEINQILTKSAYIFAEPKKGPYILWFYQNLLSLTVKTVRETCTLLFIVMYFTVLV